MKIQLTIFTLIFTIYLLSCNQVNTSKKNEHKLVNPIDTSIIAILPFSTNQYWEFKNHKPANLAADDLIKIDTLLNKCINDYNIDQEKIFKERSHQHPDIKIDRNDFIIDLTRYKRQYIATLNAKEEKEVWVNCFCNSGNMNWKNI